MVPRTTPRSSGALATGGFTWVLTLLGAATVFLSREMPRALLESMPLRQIGVSPRRSFFYGQLSAVIEPVAAMIGAAAVIAVRPMLPYALPFAAGAMIYVVVEELIPEAQQSGRTDLATSATIVGFTVMMILDVALS